MERLWEIVYRGHNIQGTNVADPLHYGILLHNSDIQEPSELNLFVKGLEEVEIDKNDIQTAIVLQS